MYFSSTGLNPYTWHQSINQSKTSTNLGTLKIIVKLCKDIKESNCNYTNLVTNFTIKRNCIKLRRTKGTASASVNVLKINTNNLRCIVNFLQRGNQ